MARDGVFVVIPVASPADCAAWERLLTEVQHQLDRPKRDPRELVRAARKAKRAVVPAGALAAENPFVRLVRLTESWDRLAEDLRARTLPDIADAYAGCRALSPDMPVKRAPRVDLGEEVEA